MSAQRQLLLLLIAAIIASSVLTAGCMSSNNKNGTNQIQQASSGTNQNQTVKLMLVKMHDVEAATGSLQSWDENWIDAGTVKVNEVSGDKSNDTTIVYSNFTLKHFSTIDDATKFVKGQISGYELSSTTPHEDESYTNVTGHKPSTYASYFKTQQVPIGQPITVSYIIQTDDIVMYGENTSYG
jgi:outer membrane murein-binding lipoprotein Lpp